MSRRATPTEIDFFRELWIDADGRLGQARMTRTIAGRLNIELDQAEELARRAAKLGLIDFSFGSVSVSYEGWKRVRAVIEKEEAVAAQSARPPSRQMKARSPEEEPLPRTGRAIAKPRANGRGRRSPPRH